MPQSPLTVVITRTSTAHSDSRCMRSVPSARQPEAFIVVYCAGSAHCPCRGRQGEREWGNPVGDHATSGQPCRRRRVPAYVATSRQHAPNFARLVRALLLLPGLQNASAQSTRGHGTQRGLMRGAQTRLAFSTIRYRNKNAGTHGINTQSAC